MPYEYLGDIYSKYSFGDGLNRATENYKKAIGLEPSKIELHLKLAKCYEDGGEGQYAEKEYLEIMKIDPTNSTAIQALEYLRNKKGSK